MRSVIFIIAAILLTCNAALGEKKVVCYYNNWSIYHVGKGQFDITNINPKLCTHLIYNIAGITDEANLRVTDPNADLPSGRDGFNRFNQLRITNPNLKTLIAVGGFTEGYVRFSLIAANAQLRQTFVNNTLAFVKAYGFNGLDLQWAYPHFSDRENFVQLLKQLKERFASEGLLLTALLLGNLGQEASYDVPQVIKYLDFANIIAFDLHGSWDRVTGINAPLYAGSWETGLIRNLNVDTIISNWLAQGATPDKLVLSIATYGRSFTLDSILKKGIGAPASQPGNAGPYTSTPGMLGYNEICENLSVNAWEFHYENEQKVPYVVRGTQWVGYDNVQSVFEKVNYIIKRNLGGALVYTLDTDDFRGFCGKIYPLLRVVNILRQK